MLLHRVISTLYPQSLALIHSPHCSNNNTHHADRVQQDQSCNTLIVQYILQLLCHHSICNNVYYINLLHRTHTIHNTNKLYTSTVNHKQFSATDADPRSNSSTAQYLTRHHISNLDTLLEHITQQVQQLSSMNAAVQHNDSRLMKHKINGMDNDEDDHITRHTIPIVIDSLVPLFLRHDINTIALFITKLKQLHNTVLISTYDSYCIDKHKLQHTTDILQHISTSHITHTTLHPPIINANNTIQSIDCEFNYVHRRVSGRVAVAIEYVQFDIDITNNQISSEILDQLSSRSVTHNKPDADTKRLYAAGTMNMSLTEKQRQQRSNTILPYTQQPQSSQSGVSTSGLFTVHGIQSQTLEQYDREDPDEALDESSDVDHNSDKDSSDDDSDDLDMDLKI